MLTRLHSFCRDVKRATNNATAAWVASLLTAIILWQMPRTYLSSRVAFCVSLLLATFLVWIAKPIQSFSVSRKLLLNVLFAAVLAFVFLWEPHTSGQDYSAQVLFAREADRPLDSLHAIINLKTTLELAELQNVAAALLLMSDSGEKGIAMSAQSVITDPSFGVGPPLGAEVPGMAVGTWGSPTRSAIRKSFVWGYPHGLDRIEMGSDDLLGNPVIAAVGDLNHSSVHILATPTIASAVEKITIVANDYTIWSYQINRHNKWEPIASADSYPLPYLPAELRRVDWLELSTLGKEIIPVLDFARQPIRHYPVVSGNLPRGRVSSTLLPGARGWLPREDGSY